MTASRRMRGQPSICR